MTSQQRCSLLKSNVLTLNIWYLWWLYFAIKCVLLTLQCSMHNFHINHCMQKHHPTNSFIHSFIQHMRIDCYVCCELVLFMDMVNTKLIFNYRTWPFNLPRKRTQITQTAYHWYCMFARHHSMVQQYFPAWFRLWIQQINHLCCIAILCSFNNGAKKKC